MLSVRVLLLYVLLCIFLQRESTGKTEYVIHNRTSTLYIPTRTHQNTVLLCKHTEAQKEVKKISSSLSALLASRHG